MEKKGIRFHLPVPEMLTNEQRNLIKLDLSDEKRKNGRENLVVQGYGGTGKTVVAYYRALGRQKNAYKSYQGNGEKVLILCFNKLLNSLIKSETRFPLKCDVVYLQEFYHNIRDKLEGEIKKKGGPVPYKGGEFNHGTFLKGDHEYNYIIYSKGKDSITEIIDNSKKWYFANSQTEDYLNIVFDWYLDYNGGNKIYKEIIIDEGQDISGNMLKALKRLTDHISIFADDHQNTQGGSSISEMKAIFSPNEMIESLTYVMRTTKEIFEYAAETFLPEDEQVKAMQMAKNCISIPESRPNEDSWIQRNNNTWADGVIDLIKKYNNDYTNIMVVCPEKTEIKEVCFKLNDEKINHGVYYSNIEREGFSKQFPYANIQTQNNEPILITTYVSAKGLEAECVIIYVSQKKFEEFINGELGDRNDNIFYTLSTRPRRKLLFVTNFPLSKYENND